MKIIGAVAPVVLCLSLLFVMEFVGFRSTGQVFESEQDFKLKFVDSNDYELGLSGITKVILPFDVLSAEEKDDYICIKTHENAVIFAPVDCKIKKIDKSNGEIELQANNIRVVLEGVISGVSEGKTIGCGEIIGTVKGESCLIQVYLGSRRLTLSEIRAIL